MPLPTVSSGTLYAHYDASLLTEGDGADVTSWPDQSGNGLTITTGDGGPPVCRTNSLNGMRGVNFLGIDSLRRLSVTTPDDKTIIMVCKNPLNDGVIKYMQFHQWIAMAKWSQDSRWIFGTSDSGGQFIEFTELALVGADTLWTFGHQQTGAFVRANQVQKVSGNITNVTGLPSAVIALGNTSNGAGFDWTLYEYTMYDGVLNSTDYGAVEDYLYNKWFVVPPPEVFHLDTRRIDSRRIAAYSP